MSEYGISYDHSMVIDESGIIQYSGRGVSVSNINNKIEELLATSVENETINDLRFELITNYPNPFNPETTIRFSLDKPQTIKLNILDSRGRLVGNVINGNYPSGRHSVMWNGRSGNGARASSGIYYAQLVGTSEIQTLKLVLLK
jgi:hypothetical protein